MLWMSWEKLKNSAQEEKEANFRIWWMKPSKNGNPSHVFPITSMKAAVEYKYIVESSKKTSRFSMINKWMPFSTISRVSMDKISWNALSSTQCCSDNSTQSWRMAWIDIWRLSEKLDSRSWKAIQISLLSSKMVKAPHSLRMGSKNNIKAIIITTQQAKKPPHGKGLQQNLASWIPKELEAEPPPIKTQEIMFHIGSLDLQKSLYRKTSQDFTLPQNQQPNITDSSTLIVGSKILSLLLMSAICIYKQCSFGIKGFKATKQWWKD